MNYKQSLVKIIKPVKINTIKDINMVLKFAKFTEIKNNEIAPRKNWDKQKDEKPNQRKRRRTRTK